MPEGTDWTLNVVIKDDEAQEHLEKLEKGLKALTEINFSIIQESVQKLTNELNELTKAADKANNVLSSGKTTSFGATVQQPSETQSAVTASLVAPVGTVLDITSLSETLKLAKQQVSKDSGLFNVRTKLDKASILGIKAEIEKLSAISNVKLKFAETDVSGVISGVVRVIDYLNEQLKLRPDLDPDSARAISSQIQAVLSETVQVLGPELSRTMERVDLSAFSNLIKQFTTESVEQGIQSVDTTPLANEIEIAVQDAFDDIELEPLQNNIEDAIYDGIKDGVKVLDTVKDEIDEAFSAKSAYQDGFDFLVHLFENAKIGDTLADSIRQELKAMQPSIANLMQVSPSQVNKIFSPWQSHLVKMANELANLSGAAFSQKQSAMLAFLNKHIVLDNISVKLGIEGIPDISKEIQKSTTDLTILDRSVKTINADLSDMKVPDFETERIVADFEILGKAINGASLELRLLKDALLNGVKTVDELSMIEGIYTKISYAADAAGVEVSSLTLAEENLCKAVEQVQIELDKSGGFNRWAVDADAVYELTEKIHDLNSAAKQMSLDTDFDKTSYEDLIYIWDQVKLGISESNAAGVELEYTIDGLATEIDALLKSNTNFNIVKELANLGETFGDLQTEINGLESEFDSLNLKAKETAIVFEDLDDLTIDVEIKSAVQKLEDIKQVIFNLNESSDNADIQKAIDKWTAFAGELHEAGGYSAELKTSLTSLGAEVNNLFKASTGKSFGELKKQLKASEVNSEQLANSLVSTTTGLKSLITKANAVKAVKMGISLAAWKTGLVGVDIAINNVISSMMGMQKMPSLFNAIASSATGASNAAGAAAGNINKIPTSPLRNIFSALKTGSDGLASSVTNTVRQVEILGSKLGQFSMAGMGLMFVQQYVMSTFSNAMQDQSNLGDAIVNTALLIKQEYGGTIQDAEKTTVSMLNNVASTASNARDELAKAMQATVQAGFADPEDLAYMMDVSDAVATSTNTKNVSGISKMLSGLVFAFNKDTSAAKQFGDEFAVALNKTSLEAEDLTTVVNYTVGQTAALGLKFSDMLTYAAMLRKGGMEPSSIGTSIRSLLIDVSSMSGALGTFIKSEGIGIPAGIEKYGQFADEYGAILEKRKQAAEQLQQLQVQQKQMKGAGIDTKGISQQISALQGQIGGYDLQTKALNDTYGDVSQNAVKFFGDVFKAIGTARKEGRISEEDFNNMFNTVQSTAANIFSNAFVDQEQYIKDLNKAIEESVGYADSVREDKLATTKGRLQRVQNEIARLMGVIYTSFSQTITKIGELVFKYGPQLESILKIVATEIEKLGGIIYNVIDAFMDWFSSLGDSTKAFLINKGLIIALIGLIGGPLMVYIGAIGSAMAGFATTILSLAGAFTNITGKMVSFFNIMLLGTDFRFMKSMTMISKFGFYIDLLKKKMATSTKVSFLDDIMAVARSPDWKTFVANYKLGLLNMQNSTRSSIAGITGLFSGFGNGLKGAGQSIMGAFKGISSGAGIMGVLREGLQGLAMAIPLVTSGFVALTIAALPYIAVIIAIIGAVALLYEAWQHNWGGIQDIAGDASKAIMDFFGGVYDFIMSIISPIVRVVQTIADAFVNIFTAIKSGNWGEVMNLVNQLSESLMNIVIDSLMSIGETIYNVISGFFSQTGDFVDGGGLAEIGKTILAFLGTLALTIGTAVYTMLKTFYTWLLPTAAKLVVKFAGMFFSFLFDVMVDGLAWVFNNIILAVPVFGFELLKAVVGALPLPEAIKNMIIGSYNMSEDMIKGLQQTVTAVATGLKSEKEKLAKNVNGWYDEVAPVDPRSKEMKAKGKAEVEAHAAGMKEGLNNVGQDMLKDASGLMGGVGQMNPFSAAEASTANINTNLQSGLTSYQQMMANAQSSIMQTPVIASPEKWSYVQNNTNPQGQFIPPTYNTPVDQYSTNMPAMTGNTYTFNIENLNVGSVEEAQQFVLNPPGAKETPVVNMGVNAGI